MTEQIRESSSTSNTSFLPLEVLMPISVSVLTLLAVTTALVYRVCNKRNGKTENIATSSSILMFSDPEANRQWLDGLRSLRYLGLEKLNKHGRLGSLGLEVRCRGDQSLDDKASLIGLPTRPQSAFLPGRRDSPPRCAAIRRSWIQNLFHSNCERVRDGVTKIRSSSQSVPEIRITVP